MQYNSVFLDWLHRRKVSDKVIADFKIDFMNHPSLGECIRIPVVEGNFNKYRRNPLDHSTPKYVYDKGGKLALYGSSKISSSDVLMTEGEMDCLVAWSANIPAVSGTGGAMSFSDEWLDFFLNKSVTLCFDNDPAGGEGMAKVYRLLPTAKILFLPDRPGVKDISDYATSGGDLHELLKTAKTFDSKEDIIENRSERIAHWQSTYFHDAYLKAEAKPIHVAGTERSDDRVTRAKQFPVTDLIKFNSTGKARCIFHAEKTASMNHYPERNNVYCFGCGTHGDAIDIYQKIHGCSFREAVEALQ